MNRSLTLWLAGMATCLAAWADAGMPRHDPFARPRLDQAAPGPAAAASATAGSEWRPALRAVVVAGPRSMALVDGWIVELGGNIDGYRLIRVLEDRAIFSRDGRRVELALQTPRAP